MRIAGNTVEAVGDDGIAVNSTNFASSAPVSPSGIVIVNNIVNQRPTDAGGAQARGRGIVIASAKGVTMGNNAVNRTVAYGILITDYQVLAGDASKPTAVNLYDNTVTDAGRAVGVRNEANIQYAYGVLNVLTVAVPSNNSAVHPVLGAARVEGCLPAACVVSPSYTP